jgi:MerR family transcriptional regulator, light-induced transcriptional regulator
VEQIGIQEAAERSGVAPATIRVWERRYGFPTPARTVSGRRRYSPAEVEALRRVAADRARGMSLPAAIEQARRSARPAHATSLYRAVVGAGLDATPRVLRKATLSALSRAMEHETLARAARPVVVASFQREAFYRVVEPRYRRLAALADVAVVLADFPALRQPPGGPAELPIERDEPLVNEWAVVIDAPSYAACLVAWEQPAAAEPRDEGRRFEALWTLDAAATRRAALAAVPLATRRDPALGERLAAVLDRRPLAFQAPVPALTALANRAVAYVEASRLPRGAGR